MVHFDEHRAAAVAEWIEVKGVSMDGFFNDHAEIVTQSILGFVSGNAECDLEILDALPHIKCIFSSQRDQSRVAILSGGGAGHEPAHAGYIGEGMLSGCVIGELFASPSVDAVLAAILHVANDAGCLLIVKNYTGDRLNFGLAAERAKSMGVKVAMVIVGDDIAIPQSNQPRGIAGTLFVHKMAGYYAQAGLPLDDIKVRLDRIAQSTKSIGVSYSSCTLPGQSKSHATQAELGLGIHGESGAEVFDPVSCHDTVRRVVSKFRELHDFGDQKIALLVNNLGSTSSIELSVIMHELLKSEISGNIEMIFGPASYMTALNMHGFSISMIPLDGEIEKGLSAPTKAKSWLPHSTKQVVKVMPVDERIRPPAVQSSHDSMMHTLLLAVCDSILVIETELNALDAKVGDGDTGTTYSKGARAILARLSAGELPLQNRADLLLVVGDILSTHMGGSSGVLLSIFFTAAGNELQKNDDLVSALHFALMAVKQYGGADLGHRTMLDAAIPAIECLAAGSDILAAAAAAKLGAAATADLEIARSGRSSYLRSDALKGVQDPGAVAIATIFDTLASTLASMRANHKGSQPLAAF